MRNPEPEISLGNRIVRPGDPPYLIAEAGVNHEASLDRAIRLVDSAAAAGADAIKFQTYKAESLASRNAPSYWDTDQEAESSQFALFKKYDAFGLTEYTKIAERCFEKSIDFASTPFDDVAVDLLDPLVSYFKVASADITNLPLLRKIGSKGKPVLLSTGASSEDEASSALQILKDSGATEVALLHCILSYPTKFSDANLGMIEGLRDRFPNNVIGYSDHTVADEGLSALTAAYTLGAVILEKHFTDDKSQPGNDHYHAMNEQDLNNFVKKSKALRDLLGQERQKKPCLSESESRIQARRSVVASRRIRVGELLTEENLKPKRPGSGISPIYWDRIVGAIAKRDLEEDRLLEWDDFEAS